MGGERTGPEAWARTMLELCLEEAEAVEGARISHGAISRKFAAAAQARREQRERLWRQVGARNGHQVADALCGIAGRLLAELAALDPEHRAPKDWLAAVAGMGRDYAPRMTDLNEQNARIIDEFRANGGKVGGNFEGAPVLLLHTTGARSGQERVNPMMYLDWEGSRFVFASKAGADVHPDWYHNLRAHPSVTVEVGSDTYRATAVPVTGDERDRIYAEQARRYPGFAEYQEKTSRTIPVVELRRSEL